MGTEELTIMIYKWLEGEEIQLDTRGSGGQGRMYTLSYDAEHGAERVASFPQGCLSCSGRQLPTVLGADALDNRWCPDDTHGPAVVPGTSVGHYD